MPEGRDKTDRLARLLNVLYILNQNPNGVKVAEIARQCGVTVRTTYRDLDALEPLHGVKIWEERTKRGIVEGSVLPPIHLSLPEAMTIFLAARLMATYANRYNPDIASTFMKLNSVVPPPLRDQIRKTMDWLQRQRTDEQYLRVLRTLAEAWVNQRSVRIRYQALGHKKATERSIDPYFIEPAATGHSSYVIGYCHRTNEVRTFKIERIRSIEETSDSYDIPPDFDASSYLASAWGIVADGELKTVKLKFDRQVARLLEEVTWHPSQVTERQPDGSVIVTLRVLITVELCSWILGWGEKVEVLEPEELRGDIVMTAKAMVDMYETK